jgi:hypothetical protein
VGVSSAPTSEQRRVAAGLLEQHGGAVKEFRLPVRILHGPDQMGAGIQGRACQESGRRPWPCTSCRRNDGELPPVAHEPLVDAGRPLERLIEHVRLADARQSLLALF